MGNAKNIIKNKMEAGNKKLYSRGSILFYVFSVILFAGAVYYFSEIEKEIRLLEKIKPLWLFSAAGAQLLTYFFTAVIYRYLISGYGIKNVPGRGTLYKVSVISFFFNQVVPSAGVSGNTFFFNFLVKRKVRSFQVISVILSELVLFYGAMETYTILSLLYILFFYKTGGSIILVLTAGVFVYLVFAAGIIVAARKRSAGYLYGKLQKIKFIKKYLERFENEMEKANDEAGRHHVIAVPPGHIILKTGFLQLLIVALDALTIFCLFYGFGTTVSFIVVILSLVCTKIISIIPFTPGALVLYESGMVFFLTSLSVPFGASIMVTLVYRFLSFWLPIPAGLILYRKWQKSGR
jgi:uncharacterized protein (TIRG00374 family)